MGLRKPKQHRAAKADTEILAALGRGDTRAALNSSIKALQARAAEKRRSNPVAAALSDAALAGMLLEVANGLESWVPSRPPGFPETAGPFYLVRVYKNARKAEKRDVNV